MLISGTSLYRVVIFDQRHKFGHSGQRLQSQDRGCGHSYRTGTKAVRRVCERRSGAGGTRALQPRTAGSSREVPRICGLPRPAADQVILRSPKLLVAAITALFCLLTLTACGEKKRPASKLPPPPPITEPEIPPGSENAEQPDDTDPSTFADVKPLFVEEGVASWYGPPYHNRKASNGETYNMNAMTAAHRTLPLNSVVRVTNLKTNSSALVRITDRGPFISGRVIDLSLAAAKKLDVWKAGLAEVRVEVLDAPKDITSGGRWCVQIGALPDEQTATELKGRLARRYATSRVLSFSGPMGDWWVRVRVPSDDRSKAQEVARDNTSPSGDVFLVRLD
jgi:rare lipoprotein A